MSEAFSTQYIHVQSVLYEFSGVLPECPSFLKLSAGIRVLLQTYYLAAVSEMVPMQHRHRESLEWILLCFFIQSNLLNLFPHSVQG